MFGLYPLLLTVGFGTVPEIDTAPTMEPRYFDAVEGTWDGQFRPSVVFLHMRVERDKEKATSSFARTYALAELTGLRRYGLYGTVKGVGIFAHAIRHAVNLPH